MKTAIWIYLLLVLFEGALRKWLLPSMATPLLVVRDPVAIYILISARLKGYFSFNPYVFWSVLIAVLGVVTAVIIGHGNIWVALFGARIFLLHFPLMFTIGKVFSKEDVIKFGKVILWISIPALLLIIIQFYSPQSAWVNRGVGDDINGAGFSGALGYFRPPGLFSFTSGNSLFFGLTAAYIFYFWFNTHLINKVVLIAATVCQVTAIPFSISRTLFFETIVSIAFMVYASRNHGRYIARFVVVLFISFTALSFLSTKPFFITATEVFNTRFSEANENEGGLQGVLLDRFLGGLVSAIQYAPEAPFFGYGIGMGTNAGSAILTGKATFLIAEGEWGRIVGEMGLLMGFILIVIRIILSASLVKNSLIALRVGNALPWMLLSFGFIQILQGQWGPPTNLGFTILAGGLIMASLKPE
jgi:hypothetical protein